jgi:hypothetical protein
MINIQRKKIQLKGNLIILDKLQYQKETFGSKVRFCVHFTGPISTIRGLCPFTLEQIFCYISGCEFSQLLICYWIFSFANYVTLTHHFNVYLENNIFIIQLFLIIWLSGLLLLKFIEYDQITFKLDFFSLYINHQNDYTAWTSYDKNNFLLLFLDILFLNRV